MKARSANSEISGARHEIREPSCGGGSRRRSATRTTLGMLLNRRWHVSVAGGLLLRSYAYAQTADQHSQPPPQFTDYRIPIERAALPRAGAFQWVDLGLLAVLLLLTAWILHTRRSRKELRVLSIFAVAYFGFYRLGCVCSIGSIQNVVFASTHEGYRLPFVVAGFFLLPLLAALFFGRVFCGAVCPMGAMQDLLLWRPVKIAAGWCAALETVPYVYLGASLLFGAIGTAFVICEYDPFVAFFRMHGHFWIVMAGVGFLLSSLFVGRPYCRFLCPYGVLLRWSSQLARHTVSVTPDDCIQCHLCANACPFDAIQPPRLEARDQRANRRRVAVLIGAMPLLIAAFAFAGLRLSPTVASWDLRVHRAKVLHDAAIHPAEPKTVIAEAWERHRMTDQEAYREGAEVERQYAIGTPIFGVWIALVISLRALSFLRRGRSRDYVADAGSCLSCARCYEACPVPHRGYGLPELPIVQSQAIRANEPTGGRV